MDFAGTGEKVVGVLGHLDVVPANASGGNIHPMAEKYITANFTERYDGRQRDR